LNPKFSSLRISLVIFPILFCVLNTAAQENLQRTFCWLQTKWEFNDKGDKFLCFWVHDSNGIDSVILAYKKQTETEYDSLFSERYSCPYDKEVKVAHPGNETDSLYIILLDCKKVRHQFEIPKPTNLQYPDNMYYFPIVNIKPPKRTKRRLKI
jgi:hypothetical protein